MKNDLAFKKAFDFAVGLLFYFLWIFLKRKLNIFVAYTDLIPFYLGSFLLLLIGSFFRKNTGSLCGFMTATLTALCFEGFQTGENKLGSFLFTLALALCFWELFRGPLPIKKSAKKPEKRGKNTKASPEFPYKRRILRWVGLLLLLLFAGARESDIIVSKLYFVPWPIYPDYTYPAGVEKINFKSLDGTLLNGWYFHSNSPLASKRPVVLYIHGNAGNMAAQFSQFNFLMDWGYDVFTFDYRGFGFSEGSPSREGLWKDTQAAFQEMTFLQPGRKYGVVGFSMGGPYALQLAAHEPRVSAAAFLTCFSSFREIGAHTLKSWGVPEWLTPVLGWLLIPNGLDAKDAEVVASLPPALFVQGTWDGNVPFEMTEKMASQYAGPHEFLTMPNYPHGDYFKDPLGNQFHQSLDRLFSR